MAVIVTGASWTPESGSYLLMKIESTAVPEPTTYALLGISLGVIAFTRKRMKKTI